MVKMWAIINFLQLRTCWHVLRAVRALYLWAFKVQHESMVDWVYWRRLTHKTNLIELEQQSRAEWISDTAVPYVC